MSSLERFVSLRCFMMALPMNDLPVPTTSAMITPPYSSSLFMALYTAAFWKSKSSLTGTGMGMAGWSSCSCSAALRYMSSGVRSFPAHDISSMSATSLVNSTLDSSFQWRSNHSSSCLAWLSLFVLRFSSACSLIPEIDRLLEPTMASMGMRPPSISKMYAFAWSLSLV